MSRHSVLEARNNLSRLIAESRSGGDVVITNRGTPVVQLVPIAADDAEFTGAALADWLDAHPLPGRLQRPPEELDAQITDARGDWE